MFSVGAVDEVTILVMQQGVEIGRRFLTMVSLVVEADGINGRSVTSPMLSTCEGIMYLLMQTDGQSTRLE